MDRHDESVFSCGGCPLGDTPQVIPNLRPARIFAIGEAPGAEEADRGIPFIGPSGRLLRDALDGLDVVYANVVQCRPPDNRTPEKVEIKACAHLVQYMIDVVNPDIILAVGATALKALTGKAGILKMAGKTVVRPDGRVVMAIIHPSWVLRGGDVRVFDDAIKMLRVWLAPATVEYQTVKTGNRVLDGLGKGPYGFDWETSDLRPEEGERILSYALSDGTNTNFFLGEPDDGGADVLERHRLIAHSATFEYEWAKTRGINAYITDDTQLLSHIVDERASTKLENVAVRLGVPMITYEDANVKDYPVEKLAERNCIHSQSTRQIYDILIQQLSKAEHRLYREVLMPATETMADLHINGVKYDEDRRQAALKRLEQDCVAPYELLRDTLGHDFKIRSTPQRNKLLYDVLKLPKVFTTDGGAFSTDAKVVEYFKRRYKDDKKRGPVLSAFLELTAMHGWRTQFLKAFPKHSGPDHILRGRYHVTGTKNGRISTTQPNMQNMPRHGPVRSCLVSRYGDEGRLWTADYKQIELVIFAAVSRDERMIEALRQGEDIHRLTASIVLQKDMADLTDDERFLGKRLNFSMCTGVGAGKFAFLVGLDENDAREYIARYYEGYRGIKAYIDRYTHAPPAIIRSPTGRKRHLDLSDPIHARNQALNFIPAEVALTIHLMAANTIASYLRTRPDRDAQLICLIHDSLSLDMRYEAEEEVIPEFIKALTLPNFNPMLKAVRDTGVQFRFDMKFGPSLGEQEEYEVDEQYEMFFM